MDLRIEERQRKWGGGVFFFPLVLNSRVDVHIEERQLLASVDLYARKETTKMGAGSSFLLLNGHVALCTEETQQE